MEIQERVKSYEEAMLNDLATLSSGRAAAERAVWRGAGGLSG